MQQNGYQQCFRARLATCVALLEDLRRLTERMLSNLPTQSFSFRGGETSKQAYCVLCSYLLRAEEKKKAMNAAVLSIAEMRVELARQFANLSIERLTDPSSDLGETCDAQKRLLAQMDAFAESARIFDETVLRRFFFRLGEESDAEHDGERCNVSQIRALCTAFLTQLNEQLQKRF